MQQSLNCMGFFHCGKISFLFIKMNCLCLKHFSKRFYLSIFRERGRERERERGREASMWETSTGCLSCTPWPGPKPTTQACALTTFGFVGQHPANWATGVRANFLISVINHLISSLPVYELTMLEKSRYLLIHLEYSVSNCKFNFLKATNSYTGILLLSRNQISSSFKIV